MKMVEPVEMPLPSSLTFYLATTSVGRRHQTAMSAPPAPPKDLLSNLVVAIPALIVAFFGTGYILSGSSLPSEVWKRVIITAFA